MQYFGGKQRIAKYIINFLKNIRKPGQIFLEPFVGSANIIIGMDNPRIGSDFHEDLIMLHKAIQSGEFIYPSEISEQQYNELKKAESSALRALVGFGCSYAGKWFGGYARSGQRNYCLNAVHSLQKKSKFFEGIEFRYKDYREWEPIDYLIYNDPPYVNSTKIHGSSFDTNEFWDIMRRWSKHNTVVISEYEAPQDFICAMELATKTDIRGKAGKFQRIEKLFIQEDLYHTLTLSNAS